MQLRWKLQSFRRGSKNMEQYINHSKDVIDHLLGGRDNINTQYHMIYVLKGLDGNYSSLVTTVTKKRVLNLDKYFTKTRTLEKQIERRINMTNISLI